jgi:predicted amidophosphoribosyltransferase
LQTTSSEFRGYNAYGHPEFTTVRSPIGEYLYKLKYRGDRSAMDPIVEALRGFIEQWKIKAEVLVPAPHSTPGRTLVPDMARRLGKFIGIPVCAHCIQKLKPLKQLKDVYDLDERLELLEGAFSVGRSGIEGKLVLLLDDLYRSGATSGAIGKALRAAGAREVFLLTVTRTRSNR